MHVKMTALSRWDGCLRIKPTRRPRTIWDEHLYTARPNTVCGHSLTCFASWPRIILTWHFITQPGRKNILKYLIANKCEVNVMNRFGQKAIYWIVAKCPDIVRILETKIFFSKIDFLSYSEILFFLLRQGRYWTRTARRVDSRENGSIDCSMLN